MTTCSCIAGALYISIAIPDLTGMWSVASVAWQMPVLQIGTGVVKDTFSGIVVETELQLWRHDCNFGTQLQVWEIP